jgi:hypothetical protein
MLLILELTDPNMREPMEFLLLLLIEPLSEEDVEGLYWNWYWESSLPRGGMLLLLLPPIIEMEGEEVLCLGEATETLVDTDDEPRAVGDSDGVDAAAEGAGGDLGLNTGTTP